MVAGRHHPAGRRHVALQQHDGPRHARRLVRRLSLASTFRGFTIVAIGLSAYLIGFHSMAIPYLQRMVVDVPASRARPAAEGATNHRTHPRVVGRGWRRSEGVNEGTAPAVTPAPSTSATSTPTASAPDAPEMASSDTSGSAAAGNAEAADGPDRLSAADCHRLEAIARASVEARPTPTNEASGLAP